MSDKTAGSNADWRKLPRGDEQAKQWAIERAKVFGEAVALYRNRAGLSATELANRTKEVGYPITRSSISRIENNLRNGKVDLAEIIALAAALEISPADLIYPGRNNTGHAVTPRAELTAYSAQQWFVAGADYNPFSHGAKAPRVDVSSQLTAAIKNLTAFADSFTMQHEDESFEMTESYARDSLAVYDELADKVRNLGGVVNEPWAIHQLRQGLPNGER